MQPTLYNIYKDQGKALPTSVESRFADPKFASAAQQAGITKDQYKINSGNADYNTKIASLYGKTPAASSNTVTAPQNAVSATAQPVTQPVTQSAATNSINTPPVMNDIYGDYNSYTSDPNTFLASKGVTEAKSRSDALAAMQAQIDATNNYYADQLRQAQIKGQGVLGSAGAIQARRGLLGSDFGAAQTDAVNNSNQQVYNSIENEKRLKIQELLSAAEQSGTARYQEERAAIESGLKSRLEFLKGAEERRKQGAESAASQILASGYLPKDMTPQQLAAYAKGYGTTESAIKDAFEMSTYRANQEEQKRQDEIADALAKKGIQDISKGSTGYAYNPVTKKYELVARGVADSTGNTVASSTTYSVRNTGIDEAGKPVAISADAQVWVDRINRSGGDINDLIPGTTDGARKLRTEVQRGLNAQGNQGNFKSEKSTQSFKGINDSIDLLIKSKDLAGTFRTRQTDPNATFSGVANLTANQYTDFVNESDFLKGQLLELDGVALKEIFGPQISNADAATIERIIGKALDPRNQRPEAFLNSLNRIKNSLSAYEKRGIADSNQQKNSSDPLGLGI